MAFGPWLSQMKGLLREILAQIKTNNANGPNLSAVLKGGMTPFTANGSNTVLNITHNLGSIPSYYSITTSEPIAINHLTRTITFPDANTMRLTFGVAPQVGENANYVWVVYK